MSKYNKKSNKRTYDEDNERKFKETPKNKNHKYDNNFNGKNLEKRSEVTGIVYKNVYKPTISEEIKEKKNSSKEEYKKIETNLLVCPLDLDLHYEEIEKYWPELKLSRDDMLDLMRKGKYGLSPYGNMSSNYMTVMKSFYGRLQMEKEIKENCNKTVELKRKKISVLFDYIDDSDLYYKDVIPTIRDLLKMNVMILHSATNESVVCLNESLTKYFDMCTKAYKNLKIMDMYYINLCMIDKIRSLIIDSEPEEVQEILKRIMICSDLETLFKEVDSLFVTDKWKLLTNPSIPAKRYLDIEMIAHNMNVLESNGNTIFNEVLTFTGIPYRFKCSIKNCNESYLSVSLKGSLQSANYDVISKNMKKFALEGLSSEDYTTLALCYRLSGQNAIKVGLMVKEEDRLSYKHLSTMMAPIPQRGVLKKGKIVPCEQFTLMWDIVSRYFVLDLTETVELFDMFKKEYFPKPLSSDKISQCFEEMKWKRKN